MKTRTANLYLALLIAMFALYVSAGYTQAQSPNATGWAQLGTLPPSTYDVAMDGGASPTLYALGLNGLSTSADVGKTWRVCDPEARYMRLAPPPVSGMGAPSTLYVTGWRGPRSSTDNCTTWQTIPTQDILPAAANVRLVTAHPLNPRILFAGMDGLGGLYRSTNGGTGWQTASNGLPSGAWVTAIATHPLHPERVLIGVRYVTRDHPSSYVFESTDTGLSWRSASLGLRVLPNNDARITGLAWSGGTLFAATSADGLYSYSEQTKTWTQAKLPPRDPGSAPTPTPNADGIAPRPLGIKSLTSGAAGALLINTPRGVFLTRDKAATWASFGPDGVGNLGAITTDPTSGHALVITDGHVWGYNIPINVAAKPPVKSATPRPQASPSAVAQFDLTPPPDTQDMEPTPPPTPLLPTSTLAPVAPTSTAAPSAPTITPPPRPGYVPSDPAQPLDPSFSAFFPQTQHNIQHGFRDFWLNNDSLRLIGYPLTEEFVENGMSVQYFERARLEYRDGKIQWGRLGAELTKGQFFQTVRFFVSDDNKAYFGPTQHSVSGAFLRFWRNNGDLSTLGYPISESFKVGKDEYQWFERGRLEWHPDFPEDNRIILGQIGREALQKRGWIK